MDTYYDLPDNVKGAMQGGLADGDAVQLPFSAGLFWAVNGDNRLAQQQGVQYFGGWAADEEEFQAHAKLEGFGIPDSLQLVEFQGDSKPYLAYTTRALAVAPIISRRRNAAQEPGKFRSHVQLLGLGMLVTSNDRVNLGPIVLTAKGYQASNMLDAFRDWERASAQARREFAGDLNAKFFYTVLGTFGAQPVFDSVGRVQQSKITPIKAQIPEEITDQVLRGRYVGKENAARMAEMREQANDWVADWKEDRKPAPSIDLMQPDPLLDALGPDDEMLF